MLKLDRRSFLATTAGLSFLSVLPRVAFADGHNDTLRVAIAGETGDLDLLQNVSTLSSYSAVFDALIHYGPGGTLEPGLATAWTVAEDGLSISFDLREGVTFSDGTPFDATAADWNLKRWMGVADFSWKLGRKSGDGTASGGSLIIADQPGDHRTLGGFVIRICRVCFDSGEIKPFATTASDNPFDHVTRAVGVKLYPAG